MELFLVRHAIALDAEPGQSDDARPLSPEGAEKFEGVVRGLGRLDIGLDRLYHSPKLRAVQTAELLTPLLTAEGQTVVTPHLAAGPGPELLKALSGRRAALVGHEPWMGELCAWLLTGEPGGQAFPFKKGGVAVLEGDPQPGRMRLTALWSPRVLRSIG